MILIKNTQKQCHISLVFIFLAFNICYCQSKNFLKQEGKAYKESIDFNQIKTDSFFNSKQIISLLKLNKSSFDQFHIEFGYNNLNLRTTSSFGKSKNALAAINGSFFDMDNGGSVTYFEVNDSVISRKRSSELKWGVSDSIINGAIIVTKDNKIMIRQSNSSQFYELSKQELAVLVAGPLLLLNSQKIKLPNIEFVNKRHPRTCLCETKDSIVFITIDGRSKQAEGMSLNEAQIYLFNIGCIDAINLDGGGSTTMWTKNNGVVNFPSDKSGERPVHNVLLVKNN